MKTAHTRGRRGLFVMAAAAAAACVLGDGPSAFAAPGPTPWAAPASTTVLREDMRFHNGDAELAGTLYLPAGGHALSAVVVTHGAGSPLRTSLLYRHLTQMLPPLGVAVFVYDRRGTGQSGGDPRTGDFTLLADDAIAAVRLLKTDSRIDPRRVGVWGLSQGGWLSLLAASRSRDVAFAVSISAPLTPADVQMRFFSANALTVNGYGPADIDQMTATRKAVDDYAHGLGSLEEAQRRLDEAKTKPWFKYIYLPGTLSERTIAGWRKEISLDPLQTVEAVRVPTLVLYGATDPEIPVAISVDRLQPVLATHPNVRVAVIAGADHAMQTSVTAKDLMDPAKVDAAAPDAPEYFARLTDWMVRQGVACDRNCSPPFRPAASVRRPGPKGHPGGR